MSELSSSSRKDSLWSPEHDWILQFDQLLSPRTKKSSFSGWQQGTIKLEKSIRKSVRKRFDLLRFPLPS